jgi:hypothetical protein
VCAGERGARGRGEKGMRRKRERRHPGFDSAAQVFCKAAGHATAQALCMPVGGGLIGCGVRRRVGGMRA